MAKPTTTSAFALVAALAMPSFILAETKTLRKGPPCKVEKSVDMHLVQIYVTQPKPDGKYVPGRLRVFLRREYPDYLYVPLETSNLKDGRLHVQIAIIPAKQATYSITVLDYQPTEQLISYWEKLSDIKEAIQPQQRKQ